MSIRPAQFPCQDDPSDYLELGSYSGMAEEQVTISVIQLGKEGSVYLNAAQARELAARLQEFAAAQQGAKKLWKDL